MTSTLELRFVLALPELKEERVRDDGTKQMVTTRPPKYLAVKYPLGSTRLIGYLTTKRREALVMLGMQTPAMILSALVPKKHPARHELVRTVVVADA